MNLKVDNNLHYLNSRLAENQNKKVELFDISHFQLDQKVSISHKEMELLPHDFKKNIREIFLKVLNKSDVQKQIKESNASSISLKVIDGKLVYKLDGSKEYIAVQDKKIQDAFSKIARKIKKYLKNTGILKEKKLDISSVDKHIIESSPSDVNKVSKEIFKKMKKSDTEWSLWAIWVCEIRSSMKKALDVMGIKFDWSLVPKGSDDILGYLFGAFGILNGIEIKQDSKKIGDMEGQKDGKHKVNRNVIAMIGGAIDFAGKVLSTAPSSLAKLILSTILSTIASIIFLFVAIYAAMRYGYFGLKAYAFKGKYTKYIENEKLNETQRMTSALKFLKSKVSISEKEAYKVISKIRKQNPNSSDFVIKKLAHEEIVNNLLTKVKRFERRVGSGVVAMIQENVDEILKDPTNAKNIEKAEKIMKKVKYKNDLTIQENKWYAIATFLQVLEIVLLLIFGSSILAAIAGGLSSAIVAIMFGAYFYKKHINHEEEKDKSMLDENLDLLADPAI